MLSIEYDSAVYDIAANIRQTGDEWIFFVHGWGAQKECFDEAFRSPALEEFSICALDLVGFGESSKPKDFSYDLMDQAAIVDSIIKTLAPPGRAHLVGHSMGGGIGALCSAETKQRGSFINVEGNISSRSTSVVARLIGNLSLATFEQFGYPVIKGVLSVQPSNNYRTWAKWWDSAIPVALYKSAQSLAKWSDSNNLPSSFREWETKAYLYGEKSHTLQKTTTQYLAGIACCEVPDSGHFIPLDNPRAFYETVAKIIRSSAC